MYKFKKFSLLIIVAMLILILLPVSFASELNSTEIVSSEAQSDILSSSSDSYIVVDKNEFTIDDGGDVSVTGGTIIMFDDIEYPDPLNIQYSYVDASGITKKYQVQYHEDYSFDPFSFTIRNLAYKGSPYIITVSAVEDDLYDDYLCYGDELSPIQITVNVNQKIVESESYIDVDKNEFTIDDGGDITVSGTIIMFDDIEYPDPLNIEYSYVDASGVTRKYQVQYHEDYSYDPFSFTIRNLKYKGSPYIITIKPVKDDLYDDYLGYGDELLPVQITVNVMSNIDPTPVIPDYEKFTPRGQLFVSPDGDDSNDGSQSNPFLTIQKALDQNSLLGGGYEVVVSSGEYIFDSYYTIRNNVSIVGRGDVKIRNTGDGYIFVLQGVNTVEFKNLMMMDGQSGAISGYNTLNGAGENSNEGKVLNIINCTFVNNCQGSGSYGGVGVIKSYSKTTILNSTFIDNEASSSQLNFRGFINLPDGTLTMNYCFFINNRVYPGTELVRVEKRSDANFNFWGTNNGPADVTLSSNLDVKTWLVISSEIEGDDIQATEDYKVKAIVKYTNSTKIYKDLGIITPMSM